MSGAVCAGGDHRAVGVHKFSPFDVLDLVGAGLGWRGFLGH